MRSRDEWKKLGEALVGTIPCQGHAGTNGTCPDNATAVWRNIWSSPAMKAPAFLYVCEGGRASFIPNQHLWDVVVIEVGDTEGELTYRVAANSEAEAEASALREFAEARLELRSTRVPGPRPPTMRASSGPRI